jgi:hypothetical protein
MQQSRLLQHALVYPIQFNMQLKKKKLAEDMLKDNHMHEEQLIDGQRETDSHMSKKRVPNESHFLVLALIQRDCVPLVGSLEPGHDLLESGFCL